MRNVNVIIFHILLEHSMCIKDYLLSLDCSWPMRVVMSNIFILMTLVLFLLPCTLL